jgi:hypothetical protein
MADEQQEKSIFDLPPDLEEIRDQGEVIAGRSHEGVGGVDSSDGTGEADSQARRFSRAEYRDSDFTPSIDENYTGPRTGAEIQTREQHLSFLNWQEAKARERHPDYDEIYEQILKPLLPHADPEKLYQFLLREDAAEEGYQYGKALRQKYRTTAPTRFEIENLDGPEFEDRMREWQEALAAARDEDEAPPDEYEAREEMKRANKLSFSDFAAYLDAKRARGE